MAKTFSKTRKELRSEMLAFPSIVTFNTVAGDIISDLSGDGVFSIADFNMKNHAIMEYQVDRTRSEKERLLRRTGDNAYADGDSANHSVNPNIPSYASQNNYLQFSDSVVLNELSGYLATSTSQDGSVDDAVKDNVFNRTHYYFDLGEGDEAVDDHQQEDSIGLMVGSEPSSRNSLLYKTRKLMRDGKIKSIISKFHTENAPAYNGEVGTKNFGESHGHNLLTKSAEKYGTAYRINGFDNPYCRVWTHHYQYDRLEKTMRAHSGGINYWGEEFEWTDDEKLALFPQYAGKSKTGRKDENYAYAWRGEHNQSRRKRHSVLDTETGLLKIAPKYLGGGAKNIHTKDCMFSIENLAWKDYDPYSFTQALSWEQRGPLGGRIMWFPPYGLSFTESVSVNWNSNDFIGRGEKVYTYVNTERRGNISFLMLTDHPSSIDYSSWWDNHEDMENDYLRYFAGCMDDAVQPTEGGVSDSAVEYPDNIHEKPPYLTDEVLNGGGNESDLVVKKKDEPQKESDGDDGEIIVEFYVFFPNNYSGHYDMPCNPESRVNAIAYLLDGRNAQKYTSSDGGEYKDIPINENFNGDTGLFSGTGYETNPGIGITNNTCDQDGEYIYGSVLAPVNVYIKDTTKKWCYRIDHKLNEDGTYDVSRDNDNNTISEKLVNDSNYKDLESFGLNRSSSKVAEVFKCNKDEIYSFMEIACAWYCAKYGKEHQAYKNLRGRIENDSKKRVDNLVDLFKNSKLVKVECEGMSTSHGDNKTHGPSRNRALAKSRAATVMAWLKGYEKWNGINNGAEQDVKETPSVLMSTDSVNSLEAKKYRSAHCILHFASSEKKNANESETIPETTNGNEYFKLVEIWSDGKTYPSNTYVQDTENLLLGEVVGDVIFWDYNEENFKTWDVDTTFQTSEFVFYNGLYYEVLQETKGITPNSGNGVEYNEYPGFVELTEGEVSAYQAAGVITNTDRPYYKYGNVKNDNTVETYPDGIDQKDKERIDACGNIWWKDEDSGCMRLLCQSRDLANGSYDSETRQYTFDESGLRNKLRYDQEYHFYKRYFSDHPMVFKTLQEKIKYFNPAFHSMTPEGFNSRLTFLHQCTRQGMTKTMGDRAGRTANNLAFGRPPYCVLRLGDFYNQMIVINSLSFDYSVSDGITWDLNTEGNGVQPMLCKVTMDVTFIGGGDITGPVRRLQNAMSFNYYANTSFYDNRADRVVYGDDNYTTMGGAGNNDVELKNSYTYTPKIYDDRLKGGDDIVIG